MSSIRYRTGIGNYRGRADVKHSGLVVGSCCLLLIVWLVGCAIATTVAIVDLVQGRTHLWLDALLLWAFTLPLVTSRGSVSR